MSAYAEFESFCALVVTLTLLTEVKWVGWSHELVHTISNTGIILGQCLWVHSKSIQPLFQRLAICLWKGKGKYPCKVTKGGWSC